MSGVESDLEQRLETELAYLSPSRTRNLWGLCSKSYFGKGIVEVLKLYTPIVVDISIAGRGSGQICNLGAAMESGS
ncbi:hypothetical protein CEXT_623071 [Caerostris extrusa]|uniref:Uncharacterized protein n=1 Tax=Caerostris extrusa TaxID=172846 RepID=A0AAV4MZK6_CAEEX|nr:hypothetical protein CEXT_623071 [Caerostris extrusa]